MNIKQLLELTTIRRASDLHLIANFPPMLRVYGDLIPVEGTTLLTSSEIQALIIPILTPTQKQVFDSTFELDLSFTFENKARFRVNVYRQQADIAVAMRMVPLAIPDIESLGLPDVVNRLLDLRQGFILITGPTGHGKTTTLAAMLNKINQQRAAHIITIEDPIEYVYPQAKSIVSQRELYSDTKSWPNALKAALREDPDVVLVGEMRDLETISSAITIAETGHLVLATLHTNSASQSIDRMIDVFPQNQQAQIRIQLAASLEAIISQRLVPAIEPGRVLAVEVLLKVPALASMIRDAKTHLIDNLIQTSAEFGMISLEASLASLAKIGKIDQATAMNYSLRPELLGKMMQR